MSSAPLWQVIVAKPAQKLLARAPRPERERIWEALEAMRIDPLAGDVRPLTNQPTAFRRRVGDWRIFFDLNQEIQRVDVTAIERRTSTTYRRR